MKVQSSEEKVNVINPNEEREKEKEKDDLKKAVAFLISKEPQNLTIEKKKEYLLKKLPPETVDKAMEIYPLILNNVNSTLLEYKDMTKKIDEDGKGFFSSFFDLGILSSVFLATLGINYLLDLNRNKKNDLFYKECEKKINEELQKNLKEMKEEISNELSSYVKKEAINERVNEQLVTFSRERGLNLNLSQKTVKDEIIVIKKELEASDKKIKDVNVKIDQSNLLIRQEFLKEVKNLIEENSKQLLVQIIENQDKLLMLGSKSVNNDPQGSSMIKETSTSSPEIKIIEEKEGESVKNILSSLTENMKTIQEKETVINQLLIQFRTVSQAKEDQGSTAPQINIQHAKFKNLNKNLLTQILLKSGFTNTEGSRFEIDESKLSELELGIKSLEDYLAHLNE